MQAYLSRTVERISNRAPEFAPSFRSKSTTLLVGCLQFRGAAEAGTEHAIELSMIIFVLAIGMLPIIAYGFWLASEVGLY